MLAQHRHRATFIPEFGPGSWCCPGTGESPSREQEIGAQDDAEGLWSFPLALLREDRHQRLRLFIVPPGKFPGKMSPEHPERSNLFPRADGPHSSWLERVALVRVRTGREGPEKVAGAW